MHLSLALNFSLCVKKIHLAGGCMQSQVSEIRVLESFMETSCHCLMLWDVLTAPSAMAALLGEGTKGIVFSWGWDSAVKPPRQSLCCCVCSGGQRQVQPGAVMAGCGAASSSTLPPGRAGQQLWTCTDHGKVPRMEERACSTLHMRQVRHSPPQG